jgi:hypothetical protein
LKLQNNPLWIHVTELIQIGASEAMKPLFMVSALQLNLTVSINDMNAIGSMKETDVHSKA